MQHFYVLRANHWKRWLIVILFSLFTALFIWFERDGLFAVFSQDEPTALAKGNANETNISLTFNISWGDQRVHDILERLKKENTQATFFVSGEWAERHPDIVEKISEAKHELGMLGYRYKSYLDQEIDQVRKDLLHAKEVFKKMGYEDMERLRTPSGHCIKEIIGLAENLGCKVIDWKVHIHEWKNPETAAIVDYVMKETSNGDIMLLHPSDNVNHTEQALQDI